MTIYLFAVTILQIFNFSILGPIIITTINISCICITYSFPKEINERSVQVNLCQKLLFLQNMGRTCCVQKLFWMSETISVPNMFSPGLSLEFSCIELVIQWYEQSVVILWVSWCRNKSFWKRFTWTWTDALIGEGVSECLYFTWDVKLLFFKKY